jgi:hypothetical protein
VEIPPEDLQIMAVRRWRKKCEERAEWKKITEKAKNPQWVVTPVKEEEEENFLSVCVGKSMSILLTLLFCLGLSV